MAEKMTSFRGATAARPSWELAWTGWIGSAPVQISECGLEGALSWWCDELQLVVVVLYLSAVSRGQAIGVLVTKVSHSGLRQGEGQSFLASSWASRAVAAAPSFQTCFASVHMYIFTHVCIYVYVCICVCVYVCRHDICIYMHVCMYLYIYAFIHMCMCMCMHICA